MLRRSTDGGADVQARAVRGARDEVLQQARAFDDSVAGATWSSPTRKVSAPPRRPSFGLAQRLDIFGGPGRRRRCRLHQRDLRPISTGHFTFLRTVDSGQTWTPITPMDGPGAPDPREGRGVKFVTPLLGYAVTLRAKTEDGGLTWTPCRWPADRAIAYRQRSLPPRRTPRGTASLDRRRRRWHDDHVRSRPRRSRSPRALSSGWATAARCCSDDAGHSFGDRRPCRRVHRPAPRGANTVLAFAARRDARPQHRPRAELDGDRLAPLGGLLDLSFVSDTVGYILARRRPPAHRRQRRELGRARREVRPPRAILATGSTPAGGHRRGVHGVDRRRHVRARGGEPARRGLRPRGKALIAYGPRALLLLDRRRDALAPPAPRGGLLSADFVSAGAASPCRDAATVTTRNGGRSWRLLERRPRRRCRRVVRRPAPRLSDAQRRTPTSAVCCTSDGGRTWRPQVIAHRGRAGGGARQERRRRP